GGGELDLGLFKSFGVRYLVQPRSNAEGLRVILNFFKKYQLLHHVYVLPPRFYARLANDIQPMKPTMGLCALYCALFSECSELFITGFTFFKSPYASGYRDNLVDMQANRRHIEMQGQHDPAKEFSLFKDYLGNANAKQIVIDSDLYRILRTEGFENLSKLKVR
ncbi:MAG: hypothetical protein ACK4S0_14385, partial [Sediminibacterium sp.]